MFKGRSVAFRLSILILSSAILVFAIQFSYFYFVSRTLTINSVREIAGSMSQATVNKIDDVLSSVTKVGIGLQTFAESGKMSEKNINKYLYSIVERNPEVYGSTLSFEPYSFDSTKKLLAPYYFRRDGKIIYSDLSADSYNYLEWHWYKNPKETGKAEWSEPYFDEGAGNIVMATYSLPFYDYSKGTKKFYGVATCDVSLNWIKELLEKIHIYKTGYAYMISKKGTLISHPNPDFILNETIFSVALSKGDSLLYQNGISMTQGKSGFFPYKSIVSGKKGYIYYMPLKTTGWSLGIFFPEEEILTEINDLSTAIILLGIAGFLVLLVVIITIAKSITKPLSNAAKATELIANGEIGKAEEISIKIKNELNEFKNKNPKNASSKPKRKKNLIKERVNKDEIFRLSMSILTMIEHLNSLISQVKRSGIQVTTSATQITASVKELEIVVAEQAASTKEVTATSKEITSTSTDLAQTMVKVYSAVDDTVDLTETGRTNLNQMAEEMSYLIKATSSISTKLEIINNKANKISSVITAINHISDQTNLLSLNAAIEAEKAGDFGKGFSVVAREISRLSDQTAVATKDIEYMVKEMQSSVSTGVMEMDKFSSEVKKGVEHVASIGKRLSEIIESVRFLRPQFENVNEGMQTQTLGAKQISEAMSQLEATAIQTKDSLVEFRNAADQLNDAVLGLQVEVSKFKLKG